MVAGFDWGARTADIMAALWPERCKGLVSGVIHNYRWRQGLAEGEPPQAFAQAVIDVDALEKSSLSLSGFIDSRGCLGGSHGSSSCLSLRRFRMGSVCMRNSAA